MDRAEFDQSLTYLGLSHTELAELLDVTARTTRRWSDEPGEIPGPAECAIRAWVRLQKMGLAWRPDGVAIGERDPAGISEQIKKHVRHSLDLDQLIERVKARGGVETPWTVDLAKRQARLGPTIVTFYPLVNGSFSPASYTRRDRAPDLNLDWRLIEDALFSIATEIAKHGPDWAGEGLNAPTVPSSAMQMLEYGDRSFRTAINAASLSNDELAAFGAGAQEVAVSIVGPFSSQNPTREFLDRLFNAHPKYRVDWPVWADTRAANDEQFRPRVVNRGWEGYFVTAKQLPWDLADFYRFDPKGAFYLRQMLDDDSLARGNNFPVGKYLDPYHVISRTAEAIATSMAFARAMGASDNTIKVEFAFRWTGLKGRSIYSWTGMGRFLPIPQQHTSVEDSAISTIDVPIDALDHSLADYVERVTLPMFSQFGGFQPSIGYVASVVRKLLERI